ncbi:SpoIIE family protein phosphatase [candidate division KSB1 bacterium]|nr:SpoIIE family protein phosphatase [candidate division KSB1 bacterium]NIR70588.1 SpoIIE family protein phosphatase [candidate division KSB1 bacterium]NIS27724.1 SpoIIE family protein phosphatase [candidate division KSB1 bacterium]NIT74552.1 SpoIIE family protein phosphatase [candidate division KSB1 bacterium]NIU28377.1 SpoIIE family protein phosphatase [candidate division KSB1 bacterium]
MLLLLLGLFAFIYILANTAADLYYITSPVVGIYTRPEKDVGMVYVEDVVPEGPAADAGIAAGDTIVAVNEVPLTTHEDFSNQLNKVEIGHEVRLTILREGQQFTKTVTIDRRVSVFTKVVLISLLPGIIFCYALLLIGTFVFLKKLEDKTAHIFYLMVLFWALAMWHSFPYSSNALNNIMPDWFEWLQLPFWPLAVGLLVHFTLIFPVEKPILRRHPRLILGLAYLPALLIILFIYAELFNQVWGQMLLRYGWNILFSVNFFVAMFLLGRTCRYKYDPHVAKQAQIMMWGTMLTLALPTVYYYVPKNIFQITLPLAEYVLFLLILWPITLAYVIIKHRFMDIDVIVKRGVAYALMSGFVVAAYFLLVVGVGRLILYLTGSRSQLVTIVATLLIAALFNPVKNRIRLFVDRRFYPSRFTYREAVRAFSHQLINVVDLQKLLDSLQTFFAETMQIQPIVVLWRGKKTAYTVNRTTGLNSNLEVDFSDEDGVIKQLQKKQQLLDLSPLFEQSDAISDDETRRWHTLGTELALPLLKKGQLIGLISLGSKTDNEPYYKEDLELLETLSDQVNISLENALLTEELREQERLRKELEVARRIQLSTLPQADPQISGLDISGVSIPALEVGGDYYDYLELVDGRFGVVVGDVSGKGTSAALYMSQLKGILKTAAKFYSSLKELMNELNTLTFMSIESKSFITLTLGAFDIKRRKFSLVRAGHLPLIYYCAKEKQCREIVPKGIGVGLENGRLFSTELEEAEFKFDSGDVFLFYSDGIIEARNSQGKEFETEFMMNMVAQNGCQNAFSLREAIISQVHTFTGNSSQLDDMTLVVVKVV